MIALLDVGVLIALVDPQHADHARVSLWFDTGRAEGWATCPITENGLVRIISQKRYPNPGESIAQARDYLRDLCAVAGHVFWPDDLSVREEAFLAEAIESASRVTDAYLLALAVHHGGQLVTIDRRFASIGVLGGQSALKLLND